MTKKEKILNAALEFFANEGYDATSTSKIAKHAEVSEGLIFRHFGNKKGLLDAIYMQAEDRVKQLFGPILFCTDPLEVITRILDLPASLEEDQYDFWKLQFKLKWEVEYNNPDKMKPVLHKLSWAFSELGYEFPEREAKLLNTLLEALFLGILREGLLSQVDNIDYLKIKYKIKEIPVKAD